MKNSAIAIIQARMSSSRLPGKMLKPLSGMPLIWHVYQRALLCKYVGKVIVATSTDPSDDQLADYCTKNNMNVYRGSLNDCFGRFIDVLNDNPEYRYLARITGDCPIIHPQYIDNQIKALIKFDGDFTWTKHLGNALVGQDIRSVRSMRTVENSGYPDVDREHVGTIFMNVHADLFKIVELVIPDEIIFDNVKFCIDEEKDYLFFSELYKQLWIGHEKLDLVDVIKYIRTNQQLANINNNVNESQANMVRKKYQDKDKGLTKCGTFVYGKE